MAILSLNQREIKRDSNQGVFANPWKEIEETVRKVDEEKVKDCTEDIDTLLVFAGLYSAVLTAFLIESYKNLFADESESLLRQMVLQSANYRFTNGYLNSTFDPSQLPTFKPAVSDIRVNVCWFASLILSLSSASFGIAVKQWLREFLAMDYISPQERLRIRNARIRGLQDWKLYQIAAFLPILLQISLALFFVGLCFFTAAVHPSIGITSLFLVSCWAFLFFISVIAPLFSPRCPYKTTILKVPFRYARPRVRAFLRPLYLRLAASASHLRQLGLAANIPSNASWSAWSRFVAGLTRPLKRLCTVLEMNAPTEPANIYSEDAQDNSRWEYYDDYMNVGILSKLSRYLVDEDTAPEEEDKMRSADGQDHIMFGNIDSVFFDDSLLAYMPQALSQRLPLLDVLQFVTTAIYHRSESLLASTTTGSPRRQEWPWTLSLRVRLVLVDMLAASMGHELLRTSVVIWEQGSREDTEWSGSFFVLVSLVSPRGTIPSSVTRLFEGLNEYRSKHVGTYTPLDVFSYQMRTLTRFDRDWPARSLLFLAEALNTVKPQDAEQCLRYIVCTSFVDRLGGGSTETYRRLLERNPDDGDTCVIAPTPQRIVALLEVARVILHRYIREQTQALDEFPAGISFLLEFVFDAVPRIKNLRDVDFDKPLTGASDGPGLDRVMADLFTTPHITRLLLRFFVAHLRLLPSSPRSDQSFFLAWIDRLPHPTPDTAVAVLNACIAFFESHPILESPAILLRCCLLTYHYDTLQDADVNVCWQKLFTVIHTRCGRILDKLDDKSRSDISELICSYSASGDQHADTCEMAYTILDNCDNLMRHHQVTDEMVAFLRRFMCTNRGVIKFRWFPDLDNTKKWHAEVATYESSHNSSGDEQKTVGVVPTELAVASNIPMVPTPADSPNDQPDDGRHEDAVPSGLVAADDFVHPGAGSSLRAPLQELGDSGSGGHDEGRAAELLQCGDLAHTADMDLQDLAGAGALGGGGLGPRSTRLQGSTPHETSERIEAFPSAASHANVPGSTQADGYLADSADALIAVPDIDPSVGADEPMPNAPDPRLPTSVPLPDDDDDDDALDGDLPSENEDSGTTEQSSPCAVFSTSYDNAAVLLNALYSVNSGESISESSTEGPARRLEVTRDSTHYP